MNYKIEGAIKKNKNAFIICLILWLILAIVFVAPVAYSSFQANASGVFSLNTFMEVLVDNITNPFATLGNIFSKGATHNFISTLIGFSIVYVIIFRRKSKFFFKFCRKFFKKFNNFHSPFFLFPLLVSAFRPTECHIVFRLNPRGYFRKSTLHSRVSRT